MYYLLKLCSIAVLFSGLSGFRNPDSEWHEYFQNDQIRIEINSKPCSDPQAGINNNYIFLRISNKTSDEVEVSFQKELWYNEVCTNCNDNEEFRTKVVLHANETVEGSCESDSKNLRIFHGMSNGSKKKLTKFEIKNLTVNKLN